MGPFFLENLNTLELTLSDPPQEEEEIEGMGGWVQTSSQDLEERMGEREDHLEIHVSTTKGGPPSSIPPPPPTAPRVPPKHIMSWKAVSPPTRGG